VDNGSPASNLGTGWLCVVALILSFPVFGFHQLTLAYNDFYGVFRSGKPVAFHFRHNDVTRKMYPYDRRIVHASDIPFNKTSAVVGYKILEVPEDVVSLPVTFRCTVKEAAGGVLAEMEDTLDPRRPESREWHIFGPEFSGLAGIRVFFEMEAEVELLAYGWDRFLAFFLQPLQDFSRYRAVLHHAAWSAPEMVLSEPERPNVIFISLDTLRADALGCYGSERDLSPAIDVFARENILFKKAFCQSTWTLPSHMSLLTGRFPNELFDVMYLLHPREFDTPEQGLRRIETETLSEVLSTKGYYTAAFTDGVYVSSYYGFYRGFHLYNENYGPWGNSFRLAREWIRKNLDKNFFLFLHTYIIHDYQFMNAGKSVTRKGNTEKELEELLECVHILYPQHTDPMSFLLNDWEHRRRDWYNTRVRLADLYVQEFFQFLREENLYDDSLIILFSDHGEAFGEVHDNGRRAVDRHGFAPYESQVWVPLIVKLPAERSLGPRVVEDEVRLIDIPQTVLAVLGMNGKPTFRGTCIIPGLAGPGRDEYPFSYAMWSVPGGSIREDATKYIVRQNGEQEELYDLLADPGEKRNLVSSRPPELDAMRRKYREFIAETGAGGITMVESADGVPADIQENLKALGYIK
jgi:arylsulfatase